MHRLFDLGVDAVMSDRPDLLAEVLAQRRATILADGPRVAQPAREREPLEAVGAEARGVVALVRVERGLGRERVTRLTCDRGAVEADELGGDGARLANLGEVGVEHPSSPRVCDL